MQHRSKADVAHTLSKVVARNIKRAKLSITAAARKAGMNVSTLWGIVRRDGGTRYCKRCPQRRSLLRLLKAEWVFGLARLIIQIVLDTLP